MRSFVRTIVRPYGLAVVTSVAAYGLALSLHRPLLQLSPFFLFYAAVAVTSWYGGFGPGLLATAIAAAVVKYYLLEPANSFAVRDPADLARLLLFVWVGGLIAWLNGRLIDARRQCEVEAAAACLSEGRAKRLSEANLIGVFFSDLDGRISGGNDEFLRLAGTTREDLASGRINWLAVTAPEHRPADARAIRELRETRVCAPYEKEHVLPDGRRLPVLAGYTMLEEPDAGRLVGFILDLSERKRAEEALRAHQQRLAALSSELMLAEERERRRIATVLHDSVGQALALAKLRLGTVAPRDPRNADRVAAVEGLIDEALRRTRSLTSEISPPVLYELGFEPAVRWLAERFREEHGLDVRVVSDRQAKPLAAETRLVLFHAVRELLVNVVKHAGASECEISMLRAGECIEVAVEDDGAGPPREATGAGLNRGSAAGGFGLFNIRERLGRLGGGLELGARRGGGTAAVLRAPLRLDPQPPYGEGTEHDTYDQARVGRRPSNVPGSPA